MTTFFCVVQEAKVIFYSEDTMVQTLVLATARSALLSQGLNALHLMPTFKALLTYIPVMMSEQYEYEKIKVESGEQLLYTRYLQNLAGLALNLGLDRVLTNPPCRGSSSDKLGEPSIQRSVRGGFNLCE